MVRTKADCAGSRVSASKAPRKMSSAPAAGSSSPAGKAKDRYFIYFFIIIYFIVIYIYFFIIYIYFFICYLFITHSLTRQLLHPPLPVKEPKTGHFVF